MVAALLKFSQGATVGGNGEALKGDLSAAFVIANSVNSGIGSWEIQVLEVPFGSAVATGVLASANGGTPLANLTPDVLGGCFRIQLRVWPSASQVGIPDTDIRCIGLNGANGMCAPPPQIWPQPLPDPRTGKPGAKPDEMNFGGNPNTGWAGTGNDGLLRHLIRLFGASAGAVLANGSVPLTAAWAVGDKALTGLRNLSYTSEKVTTGATPAVNFSLGDLQKTNLTADATPTFTAPPGVGWVQWRVVQDSTPRTITFPGSVVGTPPQPNPVSGSSSFYAFFYNGSTYEYVAPNLSVYSLVDGTRAFTGGVTVTQAAVSGAGQSTLLLTGGAHTALTASTEAPDVDVSLGRTVQFATGALTKQRAVVVRAPTYGFVGASVLTDAATVAITGAPVAGPNATITNRWALMVEADNVWLKGALAVGGSTLAQIAAAGFVRTPPGVVLASRGYVLGTYANDIPLVTTGTANDNCTFGSGSFSSRTNLNAADAGGVALQTADVDRVTCNSAGLNLSVPQIFVGAATAASGFLFSVQNANSGINALAFIRIRAGGTTLGNTNGTSVEVEGGRLNGSGLSGGFKAKLNQDDTQANMWIMFEAKHIAASQRVTALNFPGTSGAGVTATQLPANTGDLVTFVGNANANPSADGVGGHIYYSDGAKPAWRFNSTNLRLDGTAATAGIGGGVLPATPVGFIQILINGAVGKIPYYAT